MLNHMMKFVAVAGLVLALAPSAQAATMQLGPGADIAGATTNDTANQERLNVARTDTLTLVAGTYDVLDFQLNVKNFDTGTGDAGTMDEEGYIYVQDRVKDMIVSGGENVYPRVVEEVLFKHPAIADAAVFGVPHEQWGETVKAVVVLREGQTATEEEIIEFCRERATESGAAPTIRQITGGTDVTTKELFALFPKGPAKKVAKISGLGKPEGCI